MDQQFEQSDLQRIHTLDLNMTKKDNTINKLKKKIAISEADTKLKCDEIQQLKLKLKQLQKIISQQQTQLQNIQQQQRIDSQKLIESHRQQIYVLKNQNYQLKVKQQQNNDVKRICDIIKHEYEKMSAEYMKIVKLIVEQANQDDKYHYIFYTNKSQPIHVVRCSRFNISSYKYGIPSPYAIDKHIPNLNQFLSIMCHHDRKVQNTLFEALIVSEKWKQTALSSLRIVEQLDEKETIIDYLNSKQSVKTWADCNVAKNKILESFITGYMSIISTKDKNKKKKKAQ